MRLYSVWWPAAILGAGVLLVSGGVRQQVSMPLHASLDAAVPTEFLGFAGKDIKISEEEQRVAGMTNYVMRVYSPPEGSAESVAAAFSVYVGYYDRQLQGKAIHSPKNCLPGAGWEPLVASTEKIATLAGEVPINRYLIGNGQAKAVVLYWYQGRGRVAANEYLVKWNLIHDQALHGRSDEALVRVIVPVTRGEEEAYHDAVRVAQRLIPTVFRAIPA